MPEELELLDELEDELEDDELLDDELEDELLEDELELLDEELLDDGSEPDTPPQAASTTVNPAVVINARTRFRSEPLIDSLPL